MDMEPYLGANGHMVSVHQEGEDVVYTHAITKEDPMATGRWGRRSSHTFSVLWVGWTQFALATPVVLWGGWPYIFHPRF